MGRPYNVLVFLVSFDPMESGLLRNDRQLRLRRFSVFLAQESPSRSFAGIGKSKMSALGVLLGPIVAISIGGPTAPLLVSRPDLPTQLAQLQTPAPGEVKPVPRLPRPRPVAPAPPDATPPVAATPSQSPTVDSPQWTREQAENERKEENLKRVIQGICRGC